MKYLMLFFLVLMTTTSCNLMNKVSTLRDQSLDALQKKGDSIAYALVKGARESLTSKESTVALQMLVDSIITRAGMSLNPQVVAIRDSLLSQKTENYLVDLKNKMLGEATKNQVAKIRDELLGEQTTFLLQTLLKKSRNELLGEETLRKLAAIRDDLLGNATINQIGLIRDELLGAKTNQALSVMLDSILNKIDQRYDNRFKPETESFIKKFVYPILWTVGGIIGLLIILGAYFRRKYVRMLSLLTNQIHNIPDQKFYDALTNNISLKAKEVGCAKDLDDFLNGQKLLRNWSPTKKQFGAKIPEPITAFIDKVNLNDKLNLIKEYWSPKIVGELNGQYVKIAKVKGEFVWHHHDDEDELFYVIHGLLKIEFKDKTITLNEGEFLIVPKGVEHRPVAEQETAILLFEPISTLNTGNVENNLTQKKLDKL